MHYACHGLRTRATADPDKKDFLARSSDTFAPLTMKRLIPVPWTDLWVLMVSGP